jgi:hypothetical protein
MSKSCIFCNAPANSKEHVPPGWSLRLLRRTEDEKVPMRTYRFGQPPQQWMTGDTAIRTGNVCKGCNNGWMCRLEEENIPTLTPMIFGTAVTLKPTQQERITTWMNKCAMVFDGMDKGDVFYDGLDRMHFKNKVSPLCDTSVWLGHYKGAGRSISEHRTLRTRFKSGDSIKNHVLTMSIGQLVLQITSVKRLEYKDLTPEISLTMYGPSLKDALIQIWPLNLQEVSWPPPLSFNDSDRHLKLLAYRFGGERRND